MREGGRERRGKEGKEREGGRGEGRRERELVERVCVCVSEKGKGTYLKVLHISGGLPRFCVAASVIIDKERNNDTQAIPSINLTSWNHSPSPSLSTSNGNPLHSKPLTQHTHTQTDKWPQLRARADLVKGNYAITQIIRHHPLSRKALMLGTRMQVFKHAGINMVPIMSHNCHL